MSEQDVTDTEKLLRAEVTRLQNERDQARRRCLLEVELLADEQEAHTKTMCELANKIEALRKIDGITLRSEPPYVSLANIRSVALEALHGSAQENADG